MTSTDKKFSDKNPVSNCRNKQGCIMECHLSAALPCLKTLLNGYRYRLFHFTALGKKYSSCGWKFSTEPLLLPDYLCSLGISEQCNSLWFSPNDYSSQHISELEDSKHQFSSYPLLSFNAFYYQSELKKAGITS